MILDLLAAAVVNETVHWAILKMRDRRDFGTDPYRKTLEKIIQDLEKREFEKGICDCVENTVLNVDHALSEETEDIRDFLYEESLSKFEKDCRTPNEEDKNKIKEACTYVCTEFESAFTYIIEEDPICNMYKILTSISIPSIEIYLDKRRKFTREQDTPKDLFLKEEPDWMDFEKGLFVERKEKDTVLQALEKDRIHVIFGDPSSGKSHFVRWVGYLLSRDYNVFIIDLKRERIETYIDDIKKLANEITSILIVDNAHLSIKSVESVITIAEGKNIRLLIATRDIEKSHPESNLKKYIETYSTRIESTDIATYLVDLYSKIENVQVSPEAKKILLSTYGKDLWFLKWALEAYQEGKTLSRESIYERIAEERFYNYSYDIEEKLENVGEIFYYISLFSKYEYAVEKEFIAGKVDRDKFGKLVKSREFIVERGRVMLHHSSISEIYFDTFHSVYQGNNLEEIRKVFAEYFRTYSGRGLVLIGTLGSLQYREYGLIKNLVYEIGVENVEKAIDRSSDVERIGWFVSSILEADRDAGKSLLENIGKAIDRSDDVWEIGRCVSSILEADRDAGKSLIENVEKAIDHSADVWGVGVCVYSILEADRDAGKSLVSQISLPTLAETIDRSDNVWGIGRCVSSILEADRDVGKSLVSQISLPTLAETIDRSDDVRGIGRCVSSILEADRDAGKSLIENVEKAIDRSSDVWGVGRCVSSILEADRDVGKSLVSQISLPTLAETIDRSDDVWGIEECVSSILEADRDVGKSLLEKMRN